MNPRRISMRSFYRALEAYDKTEGQFDGDPKNPATKAWRVVERMATVAAVEMGAALINAGLMDETGTLTAKGIEILCKKP